MTALHKASESYTQLLQSTQLALTSPPTRPSTLQVSSFQVSSATSAVAQVVIDPAAYGPYDVAVTTPLPNGKGPEVASMTAGFTVAPASTVPAASGNYLITMTGLLCMNPTVDDQLNRDGKGDEIYGAAFVRQYNRTTGQLTASSNAKTWVYCDTNGFVDAQSHPTRQQAGSLSPLGGIDKNDFIPDQSTAESTVNPLSVHPDLFPMTLWRGTMTDGVEALIISPTVWEYDGEPSLFTNWVQNQQNLNSTLLYTQKVQDVIKSAGLSQLTLGGGEAVAQFTNPDLAVIDATIGLPPIQLLFSSGQDRPIGLAPNASQSTFLPNTAVVLTREIIEQHTQPSSGTPGVTQSGSLAVIFADTVMDGTGSIIGPKRFASYMMFIQIEKL